jgi:hypothetical protein
MDDKFPPDIVARAQRDFGPQADLVLDALRTSRSTIGERIGDRLARCIIFAAKGDTQRVTALIESWRQDYRDVIMAAEYDELGVLRLRDLNRPFDRADLIKPGDR